MLYTTTIDCPESRYLKIKKNHGRAYSSVNEYARSTLLLQNQKILLKRFGIKENHSIVTSPEKVDNYYITQQKQTANSNRRHINANR
jgi:hypothetical protein